MSKHLCIQTITNSNNNVAPMPKIHIDLFRYFHKLSFQRLQWFYTMIWYVVLVDDDDNDGDVMTIWAGWRGLPILHTVHNGMQY